MSGRIDEYLGLERPDDYGVQSVYYGLAHAIRGDTDTAIERLERARKDFPSLFNSRFLESMGVSYTVELAALYGERGDFEQAGTLLAPLVSRLEQDDAVNRSPNLHALAAQIFLIQNNMHQAHWHMESAVALGWSPLDAALARPVLRKLLDNPQFATVRRDLEANQRTARASNTSLAPAT